MFNWFLRIWNGHPGAIASENVNIGPGVVIYSKRFNRTCSIKTGQVNILPVELEGKLNVKGLQHGPCYAIPLEDFHNGKAFIVSRSV